MVITTLQQTIQINEPEEIIYIGTIYPINYMLMVGEIYEQECAFDLILMSTTIQITGFYYDLVEIKSILNSFING